MFRNSDRRGQSLVEFALILPILILLMVGLFDLGRVVFTNNSLSDGARQGARIAAINPRSGTYCADINTAARTAIRGTTLATSTVTYSTIDQSGNVSQTAVVCSSGSPDQAVPALARPGDRVTVRLVAKVGLATPFVATATGTNAFALEGISTMTVTFAPSTP